jgi:hypothetical protein
MSGEGTKGAERAVDRWLAAALGALVVALFGRAAGYPFVHWDDGLHVGENPLTAHPLAEGWRGLFLTTRLGYAVPVAQLSFSLDWRLFGASAAGYHAENVVLHAANALLAARLGRRVGLSARAAYGAAALFAVHPLVVEPACWVTGRKDLLATTLLLGALVVASAPRGGARRLACGAGLALLAMLTKPSTLVAPLLFAIVLRVARPDLGRRAIAPPVAAMSAAAASIAWLDVAGEGGVGAVRDRGALEAAREIGGALAMQLAHVAWPIGLLPRYFRGAGDPSLAVVVATVAIGVALAVAAVRSAPRSPTRTGLLFATIAYLPVSGVVGLNRWFADSYMYLPLVGLTIAAAGFASERATPRISRIAPSLALGTIAVLASLAFAQSRVWRSSSTLWPDVVARYPGVPRAWALQASGDLADGKTAEAQALYVRLHEEHPDYDGAIVNQVYAYEALGRADTARDLWRRCLELGKAQCVDVFWDRVLYANPPPDERALFVAAMAGGREEMQRHLVDPAAWHRVAAALRRAGLESDAAWADSRAVLQTTPAAPP